MKQEMEILGQGQYQIKRLATNPAKSPASWRALQLLIQLILMKQGE